MGFELDEEILQDFLVEAGEILEQLSEQLVELEQNPDDKNLLNAIFRGFHTVKGGAGFLQLDALVDCCHVAENVFDMLRNGQLSISTDLMDVVLQTLDTVNEMFAQVKAGEDLLPADPALIAALEALLNENEESPAAAPAQEEPTQIPADTKPASETEGSASQADDQDADFTDGELEKFLNALHEGDVESPEEVSAESNAADAGDQGEISDDEFEALLDQLHGPGKFDSASVAGAAGATASETEDNGSESVTDSLASGDSQNSGDITDAEFESLLDELHGKGNFNSGITAGADPSAAKPARAPAKPKAEPETKAGSAPATAKSGTAARAKGRDAATAVVAETTVRVDTKRLDNIMNMVGELVLVRNRLNRLSEEMANESMTKAVANLDVVTSDLQSAVMKTRMQPIKKVFGRFPRVVRDLARNLKKEVNLVLRGEETDLDKNLVEALSDPLVHLVRNAVDHGIEDPAIRESNGKTRAGNVVLSAEQEGDHILLSIEDDGAGMDAGVLRQKAVEKGLYDTDAADRLTDQEAYNLIFAPGFSTKTEISDVSGRGVGMDVVKTKITQLNGTLQIDSALGKGSRIIIKVPLTLAIMPTLMVELGDQSFAFPLVNVVEIFHLDLTKTNIVDGQECIVVRENVYPLFHIKRWLIKGAEYELSGKTGHVVIVSVGTKRLGLVVDQLVGQEEVVIKPLGKMLQGTQGMAGATITGDGRIALILDIPSLLEHYSRSSRVYGRPAFRDDPDQLNDPDSAGSAAFGNLQNIAVDE